MLQEGAGNRRVSRVKVLKGGVIAYDDGAVTLACVVRDMSTDGARLQVGGSGMVPDTFELLVELDGLQVRCETAWRRRSGLGTEIGARFLEAPRHDKPKRVQVVAPRGPERASTIKRVAVPAMTPARLDAPRPAPSLPPRTDDDLSPLGATRVASARQTTVPVLIAEDDPDDRLLMAQAFADSGFTHPVAFVRDGVELLQYMRGEPPFADRPRPGIILLDLNMPRLDGRAALAHLKSDPRFRRIPVIVLTTSRSEDDVQSTYDLGVTAYVAKPSTQSGLHDLIAALNDFWLRHVSLPTA